MLTCKYCNIEKDEGEYYKHRKSICKICYKERYKKIKKRAAKKYRQKNKDKTHEYNKKYYQQNKKHIKNIKKEYNQKNKQKITEYKKTYNKTRRENDLQFKIISNIRTRLNKFLKSQNIRKTNTTQKSLGCTKEHFENWIQFNLDIDNLTDYELDHIQPLASYKLKTFDDVINTKCNHWTNIIPLKPLDNTIKSNRTPTKMELLKRDLRLYIFKKKYN